MEEKEREPPKLGDTIETLNYSVNNKDMISALEAFKLLKENKYSVFIEDNNKFKFDKKIYNDINLTSNKYIFQ